MPINFKAFHTSREGKRGPQHMGPNALVGGTPGYVPKSLSLIATVHASPSTVEENIIDVLRKSEGNRICTPNLIAHINTLYPTIISNLENGDERQLGRSGDSTCQVFIKKDIIQNKPMFRIFSKKIMRRKI